MSNADNRDSRADGASFADHNVGNRGVEDVAVAVDECSRCDADSQAVVHMDGRLDKGDRGSRGRGMGSRHCGCDGKFVVVSIWSDTEAVGTALEHV